MSSVRSITRLAPRVGVAAMLVVILSATAALAQYNPAVLSVSTTNPVAGQNLTASGSGCSAGSTVSFALGGVGLGSTTATGTGTFSGVVTIPASTPAGAYTLTARCGAVVLSASLRVRTGSNAVQAVNYNSGSTLPVTGSNSTWLIGVAAALMASGGMLLLAVRKAHRVGA